MVNTGMEGIQLVDTLDPRGYYQIPSGITLVFPFTVAPYDVTDINVVLTAPVQDHSLRVWISTLVGGRSVITVPESLATWHPNKVPGKTVTVYDPAVANPKVAVYGSLALAPGQYYLHVQNMQNATSVCYCMLTPVSSD